LPRVAPEYLEQRRQQIVDAAAACFARRGFHQATMQDICEEAQLSPGAVYRYFRSKVDIIQSMCERAYLDDVETMNDSIGDRVTQDIFDELIRRYFFEFDDARASEVCSLMLELAAEAPRSPEVREAVKQGNHERRQPLKVVIEEGQRRGEIDPSLDSDSVARVMIGMFQGLVMQRLVEPDLDVKAYAMVLRALFGGGFWKGAQVAPLPQAEALAH